MTLKQYLLDKQITASELAIELNVSVASISKWNHGLYIDKLYRALCKYRPYIQWEIPKGQVDYWRGMALGMYSELTKKDAEIKRLEKEIKEYKKLIKDINKVFDKVKEKTNE